ncbi:MAG: LLM class F420-dependent oxidoreductase [Acidimicrobiales bacterium]
MKFGLAFANTGPFAHPEGAVTLARAAEAAGFDSLWTVEHVVVPSGYESPYPYSPTGKMPGPEDSPIPDPLVWLSYVAGATSTIKLGTGILILPQRNPVVLAKETATLDHLSGGRLLLGVGVGWLSEEFDAIGVPFDERGRRTDDHVAAMRALWSGEPASHHSEFTDFTDCISQPAPAARAVPIHVGGHTDIAARRAGRLGDGFFPASGSHDELRRVFDVARATADEHGRDPDAIEMSTGGGGAIGSGALAEVEALRALGVHRVIVPAAMFYRNPVEGLGAYGEDVIDQAT